MPALSDTVAAERLGSSAHSRFAFLAVTSRLLAESLDYETTLVTVAGLALPHLGAWCIVDLVEADGTLRRLAVCHPDARKQALAGRLHLHPPAADDPFGAPRVIRSGSSEVVLGGAAEFIARAAREPEQQAILRELGAGSPVTVPMVARGRMLGAITFMTTDPERHLDELDLLLAEELGRRCAIAIDNARLYADSVSAQRVAEAAAERMAAINEQLVLANLRELELTEEAQSANHAKSEFLGNMSHELRTPLSAVLGYADILDMEVAGPLTGQQRHHVSRIRAACSHMIALVNDVLDIAKAEAGEVAILRESASPAEAAEAGLVLVREMASAGGVELVDLCADRDAPLYAGDARRVRQILTNLLSNAVKFTEPGGRVTIRCGAAPAPPPEAQMEGAGGCVFVQVEDTGIGIGAENVERVFQPFFQVETGRTRTRGGTGLGLSIARRLAVRMGGDLTLRSTPRVGSCFTLWLPAAPGPDAST